MLEGNFRRSLQTGLKSQGLWVEKFPDLARAIVKPCDLVACHLGRTWLVEAKIRRLRRTVRPLQFKLADVVVRAADFRPHQLPNLRTIDRLGGRGLVAACLIFDAPGVVPKRAWMLPVEVFDMQETWTVADLGRLPEYELVWVSNIGWTCSVTLLCG